MVFKKVIKTHIGILLFIIAPGNVLLLLMCILTRHLWPHRVFPRARKTIWARAFSKRSIESPRIRNNRFFFFFSKFFFSQSFGVNVLGTAKLVRSFNLITIVSDLYAKNLSLYNLRTVFYKYKWALVI